MSRLNYGETQVLKHNRANADGHVLIKSSEQGLRKSSNARKSSVASGQEVAVDDNDARLQFLCLLHRHKNLLLHLC